VPPASIPEWVKAYGQWLYDRKGGWAFEQPVPQICTNTVGPSVFMCFGIVLSGSVSAQFLRTKESFVLRSQRSGLRKRCVPTWGSTLGRSMPTWLKEAVLRRMLTVPGWQERIAHIAQSNVSASDDFAVFCLCEQSNSDQMWESYAATTGFVVAFDANHAAFESLRNPGKLGKVTYSDDPLGTFLGSYGPEAFFRKREKYTFECEWRIIRALYHLEHKARMTVILYSSQSSTPRV